MVISMLTAIILHFLSLSVGIISLSPHHQNSNDYAPFCCSTVSVPACVSVLTN